MTLSRQRQTSEIPTTQLEIELDWLRGWHPGSVVALGEELAPLSTPNGARVEEILKDVKLGPLLRILDKRNRIERKWPVVLLSIHLLHVLDSVQFREDVLNRPPMFDRSAAQFRKDLLDFAAKAKNLAKRVRKGPQPDVVLAPQSGVNETLRVMTAWRERFEASGTECQVVPLSEVLERGADYFEKLAGRVPRAPHNKNKEKSARRLRAAKVFVKLFCGRLGQPYYAHVATICKILSGLPAEADFVKKATISSAERKKSAARRARPDAALG